MKRNLILSIALFATSISGFALSNEPKPCDSDSRHSSMQSKDKKQTEKEKKIKQQDDQHQDVTGFNG